MAAVEAARDIVAARLARVMCRTERLAATEDRNGMLDFSPVHPLRPRLQADDLLQFRELHNIAGILEHHDVMEYWKSVPFALNFMDGYALARDFEAAHGDGKVGLLKHGLDVESVRELRPIDLGNARLRGVVDQLKEEHAWPLLWLPPSLPYYTAGRPFSQSTIETKRLIFSAWTVVPKAIAALVSYEAERQLFSKLPAGKRPEVQALQWRTDGPMTEVVLSLPSLALASLGDPLEAARDDANDAPVARRALIATVTRRVRQALDALPTQGATHGPPDSLWYVVAPLLLDEQARPGAAAELLDAAREIGTDAAYWRAHQRRLREIVRDPSGLGPRPRDLDEVLAKLAIAGPGTAALRALRRGGDDGATAAHVAPALKLGLAFRDLFNLPEAYAIVRALSDTRFADDVFWKAALDYCLAGNLQAVLDEYVHAMSDWVEDRPAERGGKVAAIVDTAVEALGIKTTDLAARTIQNGTVGRLNMRSRFALRLGDGRTEDDKSINRVEAVRKAFNSPFWPFVLATTSIGQEGLDFHHYSHAVVHWNLPSNPVDLEQREGRVHRFKNHAVRRNLASKHRAAGLASDDPWTAMFAAAPAADEGMQPFWILEGEAKIERHALTLPMSRDAQRLDELSRLLGIYRLAFGQPRQDELLGALQRVPDLDERLHELLIDLRPSPL